jgi:hypothetical protein
MDSDNNPLEFNHFYQIENGPALYTGTDSAGHHTFVWLNGRRRPVIIQKPEWLINKHRPRHIRANEEPVSTRTRSHNKKSLGGKTKKARGGSPSPPDKKKPLRGVGFSEMRKKNTRSRRKKNQHK